MIRDSKQDTHYLTVEGDNFFERNFKNKEVPELRTNKISIADQIKNLKINFASVLEYGCNYGDILNYFKKNQIAKSCFGIEASLKAVDYGRMLYNENITLYHGTIANNPINSDLKFNNFFELVIVDDVFGWVSRETLFSSIANIDSSLKEDGYLFIRDFYPNGKVKTRNKHVKEGFVFNHKVPGSHAQIFVDSGMYEIVSQHIFIDQSTMSASFKTHREFESRWADTILKKSYSGYFSE